MRLITLGTLFYALLFLGGGGGGGGDMGMMGGPSERLCYLTIKYDHFEAGQRYLLVGQSIAFIPGARLYNAKREIVAEDSESYCL